MLHRKQGCGGSGPDADLAVDVLDVAADRLGRDKELLSDFTVVSAKADQPQNVDLAVRQPSGPLLPGYLVGVPSGGEHGIDRVVTELALLDVRAQPPGRFVGSQTGS